MWSQSARERERESDPKRASLRSLARSLLCITEAAAAAAAEAAGSDGSAEREQK